MWISTNGQSIWSMARWRWRSSTASSKERSSSKSKARLIAPRWSKAKKTPPERGSCQLPHFCAYRRPERNPTRGSLPTAELAPLFAATDKEGGYVFLEVHPCAACGTMLCACCDQFHCDGCGQRFCIDHLVSVQIGRASCRARV